MSEEKIQEIITDRLFVEGLKYRGKLNGARVALINNPNFPRAWDDVSAVETYRESIREEIEAQVREEFRQKRIAKINGVKSIIAELNAVVLVVAPEYDNGYPSLTAPAIDKRLSEPSLPVTMRGEMLDALSKAKIDDDATIAAFKDTVCKPIRTTVGKLVNYLDDNFQTMGNRDNARGEINTILVDGVLFDLIDAENLMDFTIRMVALKTAIKSIPIHLLPSNLFGEHTDFMNALGDVI